MTKHNIDPFDKYKKEYRKATKERKGEIIKIIAELTQMHKKSISRKFKRLQMKSSTASDNRGRPSYYTNDVVSALKDIWEISGRLCAELLYPVRTMYVEELKEKKKWKNGDTATGKLFAMSLGTMKNKVGNFQNERKKGKGISTTKPNHIKFVVKVFTGPWKDKPVGYGQIDTVVHSGSCLSGNMAYTLNFTEVHTLWIALRAQLNKGEEVTCNSLEYIRTKLLPFPMIGIHPDTGSEFLNWFLKKWTEVNKIDFTRSRSGEKNDNMFAEERNGHVVRKIIGYIRVSCNEAIDVLNELYEVECLIHNHFTPVRMTIEKKKVGAKYVRKYDEAKTPYQRIIDHKDVSETTKDKLRKEHSKLSLVELREKSAKLKEKVKETQKLYGDRLW